jgi:hypothetical protein
MKKSLVMLQWVVSYVVGLLFGLGLLISQMTNPEKVLGFLDVLGAWDPSLALVMGGALVLSVLAYRLVRHRTQAVCGVALQIPTHQTIDRRLVVGSIAFGVGWGLTGICPGPALVLGALGLTQVGLQPMAIFLVAMLAGMAFFEVVQRRS